MLWRGWKEGTESRPAGVADRWEKDAKWEERMKMMYIKKPWFNWKDHKGSTQFNLQFCLLYYTILGCLFRKSC